MPDFYNNKDVIREAYYIAKDLVNKNINYNK